MAPISTSRMESFIRRAREAIAENHRIRLIAVIPVGRRRSDNGLYIASSFIQPFLDDWEIHGIRQWGLFVRVHPDAANAYIRIDIRIGTVVSLDFLEQSLCFPHMFFSGRKRVECGISFRMTGLLVIDLLIIWMQRLKGWIIEDWWIGDVATNSMYDFRFCHLLVRDEVE
jgi:hypothetical protein